MSKSILVTPLVVLISIVYGFAQPAAPMSDFIMVDQFGYLENATKTAVISNPQVGFNSGSSFAPGNTYELRNWNNGSVIYSGQLQIWNGGATHNQSGDKGWWFNFSSIKAPGQYYVYDPTNNVRSPQFEIGNNVYQNVLKQAGRTFFYNRCNSPKQLPYAEANWTDGADFLNDQQDGNCRYVFAKNDASTEKDLTGGWWDAGDFNKYVTFADRAVHDLLWAYESNPTIFTDNWNIPESGNGIPDLIDELKWEFDWLLKMNNADGSTHLKMGSQDYNDNTSVPPSTNTDPRYYGPTCSSASIAAAGMFAHGARVFSAFPSLSNYAQTLENRAIQSWNYSQQFINNNTFETACDNGEIISGDADWNAAAQRESAYKAAVYLYAITGGNNYNQYIIANTGSMPQIANTYWDPYAIQVSDALLFYTTLSNANQTTANAILSSAQSDAAGNGSNFYGFDNSDLYRAFMPDWAYHWGSSTPKSAIGTINGSLIRYGINTSAHVSYQERANHMLHYFHGVNPLGITYLTNMYNYGAERCANEMYHGWFNDGTPWDNALTSQYGPAPGYVPGGPNASFGVPSISPPSGQPQQKSYLDYNTGYPDNSWEITEPAIYYQASYIRLLANVTPLLNCPTAGTPCDDNDPNTTNDVQDGNCQCKGTCLAAGTVCDDNDPNTENDVQDGQCNCAGSCIPAGTPCDDGNPTTINDQQDGQCNCVGTATTCELLINNSFDNGTAPWYEYGCTPTVTNGEISLSGITGANPWDAGFFQGDLLLEQNKTYTASFVARASTNRTIYFKVGINTPPYTSYVGEVLNLTPTFQTFTYTFTMPDPDLSTSIFEFQVGGNTADVIIAGTSLKDDGCTVACLPAGTACDDNNPYTQNDVEDGNCGCLGTCLPAGTACDDGNPNTNNDVHDGQCNCAGTLTTCELLIDNSFDTGNGPWYEWGCTQTIANGEVTLAGSGGTNTWDAGFFQGNLLIEQNHSYSVSFNARASTNRTIEFKVGLNSAPYTTLTGGTVNLTTTMQTFTYNFTMVEADLPACVFEFQLGGNTGDVIISETSLIDDACNLGCPPAGTPCDDNNPNTTNDSSDGSCGCVGEPCLDLDITVVLEGCYDPQAASMTTDLNGLRKLLPGMTENPTANGQPYTGTPWNYSGTEGQGWSDADYNPNAVDWVLVSLRTDIAKSTEVYQAAGLLLKDGTIEWTDNCRLFGLSGAYYVVVEHRNHMAVMSPSPVVVQNDAITYNFTSANSYMGGGSGQKPINGTWVMHTGDIDQLMDVQSYDINVNDRIYYEQENGIFNQYLNSDLDLDGDVNGGDRILWFYNNGVFSSIPK